MKTVRAMMLTTALIVCGAWVSFAGTEQKTVDSTKAVVCDTTKCKLPSSHEVGMKNCPLHKGMKCKMAGAADCKYMHEKADSTGRNPDKSDK